MKRVQYLLWPLCLLLLLGAVGCEREVIQKVQDDDALTSCFTCHGSDGRLAQARGEWENSVHASGNSIDYPNRPGTDCTKCHNHQGFLEFLATGGVSAPYNQVSSIHCFTCHNPHETGNFSLRAAEPVTLIDGSVFDHGNANLCANCHQSRLSVAAVVAGVQVTNRWGPHHGPQGDLINGTNGYEYDGETYGNTAHASVIDDACAGCHMGNAQTHNGYGVGGHSFNMVDDDGNNLVAICKTCHSSATSYNYEGIQTTVDSLVEHLAELLVDEGVLSGSGSPLSVTIANEGVAGALFNFLMVEEDRSRGVHNPAYITDLLETSIEYLEGLPAK
jgi:hypothetical protein